MESKTEELTEYVYPCPYCSIDIFFDRQKELEWHIYREHIQQALELIAVKCKAIVKRKHKKWLIT